MATRTINFYKEGNLWIINETITPAGSYRMKNNGDDHVSIIDFEGKIIFSGYTTEILDSSGNGYLDYDSLIAAVSDFFVKASGGGGVEIVNEIPASAGEATYTLLNRRQNLITGTLPNGVNSALVLPTIISGERNEVILHFKTNAVAAPTFVYSGFTPVWLNSSAISMKINKQYTIVFEQINGIVKTSFGEY